MVDQFEVCVSGGGFDHCPEHLDICTIMINEGAKHVEVLSGGVEPDNDCFILCAECDDNSAGEIAAACWEGGGVGHGDGVTVGMWIETGRCCCLGMALL